MKKKEKPRRSAAPRGALGSVWPLRGGPAFGSGPSACGCCARGPLAKASWHAKNASAGGFFLRWARRYGYSVTTRARAKGWLRGGRQFRNGSWSPLSWDCLGDGAGVAFRTPGNPRTATLVPHKKTPAALYHHRIHSMGSRAALCFTPCVPRGLRPYGVKIATLIINVVHLMRQNEHLLGACSRTPWALLIHDLDRFTPHFRRAPPITI